MAPTAQLKALQKDQHKKKNNVTGNCTVSYDQVKLVHSETKNILTAKQMSLGHFELNL